MSFIAIASYPNYVEAHIVKGRLEESGIICWLKDEHTVTIDPLLSNAVGGIKIMIADEQESEAITILEDIERERRKFYTCPNCASNNIDFIQSTRKPSNKLMAVFTWLIGNMAMSSKMVWHCFNCNDEFDKPVNTAEN